MTENKLGGFRIEAMILAVLGFVLASLVLSDIATITKYPDFRADTITIENTLIIVIFAYIAQKLIFSKPIAFVSEIGDENLFKAVVQCFVITTAIQVVAFLLSLLPFFQSVVTSVYEFFILASIEEEFIFRLVIAEIAYLLLSRSIKSETVVIVISSLISGISFGLMHNRYFSDPIVLVSVMASGFVMSFYMLKYKLELVPLIVHIVNNVIAAGSLLQHLR